MELTVDQVAQRLGVTPRSVLRWLDKGFFPNAYRFAPMAKSPWRIPESDVVVFEGLRKNPSGKTVE
jgi:excisionase family DNA binding protein